MQREQKLSILVVSDHLLVREGLKHMLGHEYVRVAFGEARTAGEALARIEAQAWRLAILDVGSLNDDGLLVLEELRARQPQAIALMLGVQPGSLFSSRALQLGAAGCVPVDFSRSDLLKSIKNILVGKRPVGESLRQRAEDSRSTALSVNLSAQEVRVLMALAAGRRTREIAAELNLSDKTISTYKRRGFNKLGIRSTAELVRYEMARKLS